MANINITSDAWTEISITSGTVQNISATADIELSAEQTDNSGVVLKPSELYQWDNETIYARAVTEDTGALRVVNFKKAAGGGGSYVLPVATESKLGGVKIGSNVTVTEDGTISVAAPYSLPTAAANTLGGVKVGSGLVITDGVLSAIGGGGGMSYSTTEQLIGTWIDGKPLYQITVEGTTPTTASTEKDVADLTALNIDFCASLTGMIYYADWKTYLPWQGTIPSGDVIFYNNTSKVIKGKLVTSWYLNCPCWITIQYTKTTD